MSERDRDFSFQLSKKSGRPEGLNARIENSPRQPAVAGLSFAIGALEAQANRLDELTRHLEGKLQNVLRSVNESSPAATEEPTNDAPLTLILLDRSRAFSRIADRVDSILARLDIVE